MILKALQAMHYSNLSEDELVEAIGERALARARDAALFEQYAPVLSYTECHALKSTTIDEVVAWLERRRFTVLRFTVLRGRGRWDETAISITWRVER